MERIKKYEPLWGEWIVKRKIGEGSFGAVYEAEKTDTEGKTRSCAVKLISFRNTAMQDRGKSVRKSIFEAIFMEESLGGEHIVDIYDYYMFPRENTTDIIIRMELLTNLNEYRKMHKTNPKELRKLVIRLGIHIGKALEKCEKEKSVYQDIKPDNILVDKNGTFKLGDFLGEFGLSRKTMQSAAFSISLGRSVGTPLYRAPEALGWMSKTDHQSDIYSLGIVMYQLLNDGNIPFVSDMENFEAVYDAIGKRADGEEIPAPKHEKGELWRIIQKACQFKKEDRYQSAEEFRKNLEKIKERVEVEKRESTLGQGETWGTSFRREGLYDTSVEGGTGGIQKYEPLWGKWTVKRMIGEGSFGAVYEVESEKFGSKSFSAVKLIHFKNAEMLQDVKRRETLSSEQLEQLKIEEARKNVREAALMDKLRGRDHIVTIHDYDIFPGESTTDVIIRMELLTNLNDYMKSHKTDSEEELKKLVIKIGIDIGKALEECEEEEIVHRDIKPDNIFVNKNGNFKLGDFGLSLKMSKSASFSLRKAAGTPLYMAPEALSLINKTGYFSDIYSLGIVMYQLLNDGNIPFALDMESYDEINDAIVKRAEGEKLSAPKHDRGDLWKVIQKACQYKKENRYQSAGEFRKELENIQDRLTDERRIEKENKENTLNQQEILKELSRLKEELERLTTQRTEKRDEKFQEEPVVETQYNIGDSIFFGRYPQDADGTVRAIEWKVLKKEGNKALLLSKYALDAKSYNKKYEDVTWETSDIRKWLNNEFYGIAFNNKEKEKIQTTLVRTEDNPKYGTNGGNDTKDKVFLLSIKEAEILFLKDEKRAIKATEYAKEYAQDAAQEMEGAVNKEHACAVFCWLRSPGRRKRYAAVLFCGDLDSNDCYVEADDCQVDVGGWDIMDYSFYANENLYGIMGVQPALWLNL